MLVQSLIKKEVIYGVPQGAVLAPIIVLVNVNDPPLSLTSTCADIFADDTTTGTSSHSIYTLVDTLTTDLQNVLSWCNSNNVSLNVSKTKLMYIRSRHRQQILATCDHDISICDSKIQVSSVEKLLGVIISNTLCWDAHINHLIKNCNSYLFLLSIIKVFLSRRNIILFYNSYILPHLDLCCIIWGNCSSTLKDKLVKGQKRAAGVILDCGFIHHPQNYLKNPIGKHFQKELHIKKQF